MFTTQEYIKDKGLEVQAHDPVGLALVGKHLQKLGYRRVRRSVDGRQIWGWVTADQAVDRTALIVALSKLEVGHGHK